MRRAREGLRIVVFVKSCEASVCCVFAGGSALTSLSGRRRIATIKRKAALCTQCNAITNAKTYQKSVRGRAEHRRDLFPLLRCCRKGIVLTQRRRKIILVSIFHRAI